MQIEWRANIFWELPNEIATEISSSEVLRVRRFQPRKIKRTENFLEKWLF